MDALEYITTELKAGRNPYTTVQFQCKCGRHTGSRSVLKNDPRKVFVSETSCYVCNATFMCNRIFGKVDA